MSLNLPETFDKVWFESPIFKLHQNDTLETYETFSTSFLILEDKELYLKVRFYLRLGLMQKNSRVPP